MFSRSPRQRLALAATFTFAAALTLPASAVPSTTSLNAAEATRRAERSAPQLDKARAAIRSAAAKVDASWALFLPKLDLTARYLRLSDFEQPSLGGSSGYLVGTTAEPGTINPPSASLGPLRFKNVLNNLTLEASVAVPLSDYFTRIAPAYAAALKAEKSSQWALAAERAQARSRGAVAYYQWVRAQAVIDVARSALRDQKAHLADVSALRETGMATEVDVLQREAAVASAELQLASTQRLATMAETQLRLTIGARDDERLLAAEKLESAEPASADPLLGAPARTATPKRCELAALRAAADAERAAAQAEGAAALPSLTLLGQALYANPNPRYLPPEERWLGTWALGAQLTWSPNTLLAGTAAARGAEARAAELEARRREVEQAITLEIADASTELSTARAAIQTAERQLRAASRAYENGREAFRAGRFTNTALSDIETELTRARLARVNARADLRIARVRLAAALGTQSGC